MWINTPLEGVLALLFVFSMMFAVGIQSEQRVRESWLVSLKHKKWAPSESEIKANLEVQIADCNKKKDRWFWFTIILLVIMCIVEYS